MASANIKSATGAKITVEGTPTEIAQIIAAIEQTRPFTKASERVNSHASSTKRNRSSSNGKSRGPTGYVSELKNDGFFKERRSLNDVRLALEQNGHIYPRTTLSPVLLALVKSKELGRVKSGHTWAYVHRH
jgi:hypothetical protein